jgi:hypothetical protein
MSKEQELEIIKEARKAFERADKIAAAKRKSDEEIRNLCRRYGDVMRVWGWQSHMLRQAVEARLGKRPLDKLGQRVLANGAIPINQSEL